MIGRTKVDRMSQRGCPEGLLNHETCGLEAERGRWALEGTGLRHTA